MRGNTLHDLALDIVAVVAHDGATRCITAGHAFGNKVARALASRHPDLVRGVIMLAGAGRAPIPDDVRLSILGSGDLALPDAVRIKHLMKAFFAPGNDPTSWLKGWYPATKAMELEAERLTPLDEFIPAGRAPILDLQADDDTVVPPSARQCLKNEIGERVTIAVVKNAGHALIPEQPQCVAEVMHAYIGRLPA
jgi:pimeloyl-ACP methyl ester carboxylesterase